MVLVQKQILKRHNLYKVSTAFFVLVIMILVHATIVNAATDPKCIVNSKCAQQPTGTCFLDIQGAGFKIQPCSQVFKIDPSTHKWIDPTTTNQLLDTRGCYLYTAGVNSSNVAQVNCDASPLTVVSKVPVPARSQSGIDGSTLPQVAASNTTINTLLDILFGIVGSIAILMVSIGGLKYVLSNGDPNQVSQAKNTILYALIGLIITITGYSIIQFIIGNI